MKKGQLFATLLLLNVVLLLAQYVLPKEMSVLKGLSLLCSVALVYLIYDRVKYCQRLNQLPGTKVTFGLLGDSIQAVSWVFRTRSYHKGISNFLTSHCLRHKEGISVTWLASHPIILLTAPEAAGQLLTSSSIVDKGSTYSPITEYIGDGLLTSPADKWTRRRKLLTPAFHYKRAQQLIPVTISNAKILIDKLRDEAKSNPDGIIEDLAHHIFPCVLDIVCESSMAIKVNAQNDTNLHLNQVIRDILKNTFKRSTRPSLWLAWVSRVAGAAEKMNAVANEFNEYSKSVIWKHLNLPHRLNKCFSVISDAAHPGAGGRGAKNLINILLDEHRDNPQRLSLDEVRKEINVLLSAGQDTTGWTVLYAMLLLGHHPQQQLKAQEEIDRFFECHPHDHCITLESLKQLEYVEAVVKETLRIYPPIALITREAEQDVTIGGYTIPKNTEIAVFISEIHKNSAHWPEPERFIPERFVNDSCESRHPFSFIPFSAGIRNCIGKKFAQVETKLIISHLLSKYTIESLTKIHDVTTYSFPVSATERKIAIRLKERHAS